MITVVRPDDFQYFIEEGHWKLLTRRDPDETVEERAYFSHEDFGYMMCVVQGPGGLLGLIGQPVICLFQSFGAVSPVWTIGNFPAAPEHWRDGYVKVSIARARREGDLAMARGTLITTLEAIWQKALGPSATVLRHYGISPTLENEGSLTQRAAKWLQTLRQTFKVH